MGPSILIVGAGCVGQVFGHHLARGGADVTLFVREKYRADAERGFTLHRLSLGRAPEAERFVPQAVVSRSEALSTRRFDQVYVTVSSPALAGPWLEELLAPLGTATLVSLQPGRDDLARTREAGAPAGALVAGSIGFLAYTAPLPGETRFSAPGTAYWLPPLVRCLFSGEPARVAAVRAALRRGGLPAASSRDVHRAMALPNALGMAYLLGLEAAGWSERALWRGPEGRLCRDAMCEVAAIVARDEGRPVQLARLATAPLLLRLGFGVARRLAPLPLEPYLARHFTKVGAQTRQMIAGWIVRGRSLDLPVARLETLLARVNGASAPEPAQVRLGAG